MREGGWLGSQESIDVRGQACFTVQREGFRSNPADSWAVAMIGRVVSCQHPTA